MYNSQYYTCEQIDQRLLQGYLDDYNAQTGQSLTKEQFMTKLGNVFAKETIIDNTAVNIGYFVCDTAAGTAAKTLTAAGYAFFAGGSMKVKFANKNTANNVTLNINSQGAKALYYQGERASATNSWDVEEVVEIYYDGTSYYANNVIGGSGSGVYDVSVEHPTAGPNGDGKFTLDYILNSSNVNDLIPVNKRRPGMTIQFVSTSDNKYVQYRLMSAGWSINVADWQGVEDKPTVGSNNLVKSSGVSKYIGDIFESLYGYTPFRNISSSGQIVESDTFVITDFIPIQIGDSIHWYWGVENPYQGYLYLYDSNKNYLDYYGPGAVTSLERTVTIPDEGRDYSYIRCSMPISTLNKCYIDVNGITKWYVKNLELGIKKIAQSEAQSEAQTEYVRAINFFPVFEQGTIAAGIPYPRGNYTSLLEIRTDIMPYGEIAYLQYNSSVYDVWGFYYRDDFSFISYAKLVNGALPNVSDCAYVRFTMFPIAGGNFSPKDITVPNDINIIRENNIYREDISAIKRDVQSFYNHLYGEKLIKQTYIGERISLFDDSSVNYERKQFSTIPFESTQNQSFAVNGEYIIFLFDSTMKGVMYRLTDNTKVCDLTFPTDSTYGGSHNNACGFGTEKYNDSSVFPLFYISQFNAASRGYLAYDLVYNQDGTYTPKLVQIICPSTELKKNTSFGLGPGDFCIDTDNSKLYHIGYELNQIGGNGIVSKFTMPTKNQGVDFASSTGDTIKVVTLQVTDLEDSFNIGATLLQDNCYYKGHILKTGSYLTLIDLTSKTIRNISVNVGVGFEESEGIDVYMNKLIMNYWGKQGIFEFKF